ncbi:MAG TPA: sugar transferase [Solirubrobacterales bacterium]|nr:sugar transferase [Solirubrobacterales bacterium]
MSDHDASGAEPRTLQQSARSDADAGPVGADRSAGAGFGPTRGRELPPVGIGRIEETLVEVHEGGPNASSAARDAVYRRLLAAGDLIAAAAAFVIAVPVLGNDALGIGVLLAIPMVVLVCKLTGLYDRDEHLLHKTTLDEAPAVFRIAALCTLLALLAGELIVAGDFSRSQAAFFWVLLFCLMLLMRVLARRLAGKLVAEERCVILGNAEAAHWLSSKLGRCDGARVQIVGRVPLHPDDRSTNELPVLGSLDSLGRLLDIHEVDRALIAPGRGDGDHRLLNAIRVVKRLGVRVSVLPRLFEAIGSAYEVDDIEGATLLGVRRHGLSRSSWLIKRSFDLAGALFALLLLAPLMAIVAAVVKLDSRGPVFFRQPRVGRDDRVFEIYKFRTMVDGADARRGELEDRNEAGGGLFKIADDPRITRVGRFLRKTSLDELPQFFNVVRGDMALVGPRPLVVQEDRLIEGHHRHRLLVPPGVTGLWQIFGSARIPLNEMVKIDYLYGANWSLWLDVKILLRTVPFVLGRRGL